MHFCITACHSIYILQGHAAFTCFLQNEFATCLMCLTADTTSHDVTGFVTSVDTVYTRLNHMLLVDIWPNYTTRMTSHYTCAWSVSSRQACIMWCCIYIGRAKTFLVCFCSPFLVILIMHTRIIVIAYLIFRCRNFFGTRHEVACCFSEPSSCNGMLAYHLQLFICILWRCCLQLFISHSALFEFWC